MSISALLRGIALVAILLVGVGTVLAQGGLDQTYTWPEQGISMAYPTGWAAPQPIMDNAYGLAVNPADLNASRPGAPIVLIFVADTPGGLADVAQGQTPEEILGNLIADITGSSFDPGTTQTTTIASCPAMRVQGSTPDHVLFIDGVIISVPDDRFVIVLAGMPFDQQTTFIPTFDQMLASLTIDTAAATIPPVNGVRITLDQTLTGSWNEIDAVELVGVDENDQSVRQWASGAEATSQYNSTTWSAMQATGAPDTPACGDFTTAWASATSTGQDSLTLTYDTPVLPSAINVYQSYNPGAITHVEVLPADGAPAITVFEGVDPTTACPGVFTVYVGGGTIEYGQAIISEISGESFQQDWMFTGNAGDAVTITMIDTTRDDTLDPYLILLDSTGAQLITNDDAQDTTVGPLNAQIVNFVLPDDGTYTIRATRFAQELGTSFGSYTLTLDLATLGTSTTGGAITYGQTVSGLITDSVFQQDWTFTGQAGDTITITMIDTSEATPLDSYLLLLDGAGNILIENDDGPAEVVGPLNAMIAGFTLPASSTYTIRAARFGQAEGSSTGAYDLTLILDQ